MRRGYFKVFSCCMVIELEPLDQLLRGPLHFVFVRLGCYKLIFILLSEVCAMGTTYIGNSVNNTF